MRLSRTVIALTAFAAAAFACTALAARAHDPTPAPVVLSVSSMPAPTVTNDDLLIALAVLSSTRDAVAPAPTDPAAWPARQISGRLDQLTEIRRPGRAVAPRTHLPWT